MMLEGYAKKKVDRYFLEPVSTMLMNYCSSNPNLYTYSGLGIGLLMIPMAYWQLSYISALMLILSGVCDMLDGHIARSQGRTSAFGTVLDIISDRLVEFAAIYAIYLLAPVTHAHVCLLMLGSTLICVTSFLVVGMLTDNSDNKGFHYSQGLIERAEAFGFFFIMLLIPSSVFWLGMLFFALVMLTSFIRVWQFGNAN